MDKLVLVDMYQDWLPNLGLGYIASYLKKHLRFDNIEIIEAHDQQKEKVLSSKPDILGIKSNTCVYPQVVSLASEIKSKIDIPIIIGGPHISFLPDTLPDSFDIGVIGEGEQTMYELMQLYLEKGKFETNDLKRIDGIVYHSNGGIIKTNSRDPIQPIDKIPFPDRSLFDMKGYLRPQNLLHNYEYLRGTSIFTSRGCPYKCIFCDPRKFWQTTRVHSAEYVAGEIKLLVEEYGVEAINIEDSLFVVNIKRIEKINDLLEDYGILGKVKFSVEGRANLINERMMNALTRMGTVSLLLGLESGSERVLRQLKKGTIRLEQNKKAVELANQYGIGVHGTFIIGSPTETKEEMLDTLEFIKNISIHRVGLGKCTPFPGSKLWDEAKERGLVQDEMDWTKFELAPESAGNGSIYMNEIVPVSEFLDIIKEFQKVINRKHIRHFISCLSVKNLIYYFIELLRNSEMKKRLVQILYGAIRGALR